LPLNSLGSVPAGTAPRFLKRSLDGVPRAPAGERPDRLSQGHRPPGLRRRVPRHLREVPFVPGWPPPTPTHTTTTPFTRHPQTHIPTSQAPLPACVPSSQAGRCWVGVFAARRPRAVGPAHRPAPRLDRTRPRPRCPPRRRCSGPPLWPLYPLVRHGHEGCRANPRISGSCPVFCGFLKCFALFLTVQPLPHGGLV